MSDRVQDAQARTSFPLRLLTEGSMGRAQAMLLLETFWRLTNKIDSPAFNSAKLLYLLVEEISLLFEVLVVRIANANQSREAENGKRIFGSDMNVSVDDYKQLVAAFSDGFLTQNRVATRRLTKPIDAGNNTVRFIDSALLLPVSLNASEPALVIEIYYALGKQDVPDRSDLAEELLREVGQDARSPFREGLLEVLTETLHTAMNRTSINDEEIAKPPGSVRKSKLEFLRNCAPVGAEPAPDKFVQDYRDYFRPIDAVFEKLRRKFPELPNFYFVYRRPEDDHLSFFPTANQVSDLLGTNVKVDDFKHLWTYPYQKTGLIGYVLKTGHAIYLPNQQTDNRYTDFCDENTKGDSEIRNDGNRQRLLLNRLYYVKESSRHTYIVPIFFAPGSGGGVFVALSCLTDKLGDLANPVRKRMFDLAWESATAVELSLIAQDTTEAAAKLQLEVAQEKLRVKDAEVKARVAELRAKEADRRVSLSGWLGHTLPKFVFKPMEFYIQKMHTDLRNPTKLLEDYDALSFFSSKGQTEFRWFLEFNIAPLPVSGVASVSSCSVVDVMTDVKEIYAKSRDLVLAGRFDRWDSRKADGKSLRNIAESSLTLDIEPMKDSQIMGSKESHVIALWNIIDNALDSFEWNLLYGSIDTRFSIRVEGACAEGLFRVRVSNNGREIKESIGIPVRALLDAVRSDTPDVVKLKGEPKSADEVMGRLREDLNKENLCQGLYRTARFLHGLSPAHPGYIEFGRKDGCTVFDLYIPKRP